MSADGVQESAGRADVPQSFAGRRFRAYRHPELGWDAVKVGFSWPGFIFHGLYAICVRRSAYRLGIVLLTLVAFLMSASPVYFPAAIGADLDAPYAHLNSWQWWLHEILFAAIYGLGLVMGFKTNEWREEWLADKGFVYVGVVLRRQPVGRH